MHHLGEDGDTAGEQVYGTLFRQHVDSPVVPELLRLSTLAPATQPHRLPKLVDHHHPRQLAAPHRRRPHRLVRTTPSPLTRPTFPKPGPRATNRAPEPANPRPASANPPSGANIAPPGRPTTPKPAPDRRREAAIDGGLYLPPPCEGGWSDADENAYRRIKAAAAEQGQADEAAARAFVAGDEEGAAAAAAAERAGRRGRSTGPERPEPARSDDRGECQTEANPRICRPPAGEDEAPPATTEPAPETAEPEAPQSVTDFADEAAEVSPGDPNRRHPDGPVTLGAPVLLRTLTDLLCPPEQDWRAGGWTGCGAGGELDYLRDPEMGRCHFGPVELGIGDSYRIVETAGGWDYEAISTVLGFSAVTESGLPRLAWTLPLTSATTHATAPDGAVTEWTETGTTALKWVLLGGPDYRGLNADGSLAWGTFAIPAGNRPC